MPRNQVLLVVLDPTADAQPALERAVRLATRTDARLDLLICDYQQDLGASEVFDQAATERARKNLMATNVRKLQEQAKRLADEGLDVTTDARWDHPLHEGIVRKAVESEASVVFKDTHYHPALRRSLFSNTDWSLIRTCPVPLWLVKPRPMTEEPCIVAAVDPLHEHDKPATLDERILAEAESLCATLGGSLQVFHAYDVAPALAASADSLMMPIAAPVTDIADALLRRHTEAVLAVTDRHSIQRGAVHVCEGEAARLLVKLTEQMKADIVVIGAVSRSGMERLFVGSTAERVLDKLPCDLLIVRPA